MARSTEHDRIDALRALFAAPGRDADVALGIGDDAAVLLSSSLPLVASIDAHVEGVHFSRALLTFEDLGYRATMAALSDIAAMGARASGVLASVCLPSAESDETLFAIARGQRDAALECGTSIIGGNLSRADAISIATTVLGHAERPIERTGARDGDVVLLGGPVGLAAAGLRVLSRGAPTTAAEEAVARAFRRPVARIELGLRAASAGVSAMIDVSDGLAQDALHIARASGVDLILEASALEDPTLAEESRQCSACRRSVWRSHGEEKTSRSLRPLR